MEAIVGSARVAGESKLLRQHLALRDEAGNRFGKKEKSEPLIPFKRCHCLEAPFLAPGAQGPIPQVKSACAPEAQLGASRCATVAEQEKQYELCKLIST